VESGDLSSFDRQLLCELEVDGRASFAHLAEKLGVSPHTVARRYRRLHGAGVRVIGAVDPRRVGDTSWYVRIRCTSDVALPIATALARRDDTTWVGLTSGGTEITCNVRSGSDQSADELLLQKLPHTPRITSVSAHYVLHEFYGAARGWQRMRQPGHDATDPSPVIPRAVGVDPAPTDDPIQLTSLDEAMIAVLGRDGRASHTELANATGSSESTVRRRLAYLLDTGAIWIGLEMDEAMLGTRTVATFWLAVAPAELTTVGTILAGHPEVPFVAATTGPTNLMATVICQDTHQLYRYLTERIGSLPAIHQVETAPRLRTVKREAQTIDHPPRRHR
jgi:DNA-binding Lrp family transcriptional regulator